MIPQDKIFKIARPVKKKKDGKWYESTKILTVMLVEDAEKLIEEARGQKKS